MFDAFNKLIARNFCDGEATFTQDQVLKEIRENVKCTKQEACLLGYLNVEEVYRAAGWQVEYDRPGYNETYPASFTFTR